MSVLLFLLAAVFAGLAFDAWRLRVPRHHRALYSIEARARSEPLDGVALTDQQTRQRWQKIYGVGQTNDLVWLWIVLTFLCLVAAIAGTLT